MNKKRRGEKKNKQRNTKPSKHKKTSMADKNKTREEKRDAKLHPVARLSDVLRKNHKTISEKWSKVETNTIAVSMQLVDGPASDVKAKKMIADAEEIVGSLHDSVDELWREIRVLKRDVAAAKEATKATADTEAPPTPAAKKK